MFNFKSYIRIKKEVLFFFVILCVSIAAMAQGYLKFKGMEIDG